MFMLHEDKMFHFLLIDSILYQSTQASISVELNMF